MLIAALACTQHAHPSQNAWHLPLLQAVPRNAGVQDGPWSPQDEQLVASATANTPQQRARKPRFSEHGERHGEV